MSVSEDVVVPKTSYQMLGILSFSDRERALPPFVVKKKILQSKAL